MDTEIQSLPLLSWGKHRSPRHAASRPTAAAPTGGAAGVLQRVIANFIAFVSAARVNVS